MVMRAVSFSHLLLIFENAQLQLTAFVRFTHYLVSLFNDHRGTDILHFNHFYPRDAMLARVFATATCLSVCLSVCPSHAGIVPSRAKAGS